MKRLDKLPIIILIMILKMKHTGDDIYRYPIPNHMQTSPYDLSIKTSTGNIRWVGAQTTDLTISRLEQILRLQLQN